MLRVHRLGMVFLALLVPLYAVPEVTTGVAERHAAIHSHQRRAIVQLLTRTSHYFIRNQGQVDRSVGYYVQGSRASLYFTLKGVTFAFTQPEAGNSMATAGGARRWAVKVDFVGASPRGIAGQGRTQTALSYFRGPRSQWETGVPTYSSIVYRDVWPGIDLIFSYPGGDDRIEYTFRVRAGADPRDIKLAFSGATQTILDGQGRLRASTPLGSFDGSRPVAYQILDGHRSDVYADYLRAPDHAGDIFGFRVGHYDPTRTLVIDPIVLVYCGYIGGSNADLGFRVAVDGAGDLYVVGQTSSTEATFPVSGGPDLTYNGDPRDAFIAKVSPDGSALLFAGYIGGSGEDSALSVAVDAAGNAYLAGTTGSTEATFPVIGGPDLTYNGGVYDAFVAKVSPVGMLVYCGYIGGSGNDSALRAAVGADGSAYVGGYTSSTQASFPVTVGPDLTYNGNPFDGFVARVTPDGSSLVYAGFIGGTGEDRVRGLAIDDAGDVYVAGFTSSTEATFPVTVGPDVTYKGGPFDAFVAKVSPDGASLLYAGYIGGNAFDAARGIDIDAQGDAYVTGDTSSTEATFPVAVGPDLTYNGGTTDAFVAKVDPTGTGLVYSGYIGGSDDDHARAVAVDSGGDAYVVGSTQSSEATFPVALGPDLTYNGGKDGFISKVRGDGSGLAYSGYIGGGKSDEILGVDVDGQGNAYVTGDTTSTAHSFPVAVGPDLSYNGNPMDAFVAKISILPPTVTISSAPPSVTESSTATFTFTSSDPGVAFSCSLDGSVAAACSSPASYTSLAQGVHDFTVQATDDAGTGTATWNWTIVASGHVVFRSKRDKNDEIYIMNSDGSGVIRLTSNGAVDQSPALSPDGTKVAFRTSRDGNDEIYVMNADGSNPVDVTNDPATDSDPAWSPDGTQMAFVSTRTGNADIWVMNADGSNPGDVSKTARASESNPDWSPDGSRIVYTRLAMKNKDIWVMNADGNNQSALTSLPGMESDPAWFPNGSQIAYSSDAAGSYHVWLMNTDGTGAIDLSPGPSSDRDPGWSPDGSMIAFTTDRDGNNEIYEMNADGSSLVNITNRSASDDQPDWGP